MSKFALIIWMLDAWLLEKNYSASLTSMMTVQQLQPVVSDVDELLKSEEQYVGYQTGSFVKDLLTELGFKEHRLRSYSGVDQYHEALSKGSPDGVTAIFDEVPFLNLLLGRHCNNYSMVGRVYNTGGFGFVFPKGSPLVPDVSRAILNVTEGKNIGNIERKWFGDPVGCSKPRSSLDSNSEKLDIHSFWGVFVITCALWGIASLVFLTSVLYKKCSAISICGSKDTQHIQQQHHIFEENKVTNNGLVVAHCGEFDISSYMEDGVYVQHKSSSEP